MRTVLITGGSRGIGAATVRKFAENGDRVYFLYEKSREQAEEISRETGAQGFQCDVRDEARVKEVFSQIGPVDVLVNNAGIVDYGPINWVSAETFRRILDVNVTGMFLCCQTALSGMLQKQQGAIVNLSSMWGRVGSSCEVAYSASKGAVIAMTKALAKELGPSGIRVNAVAPGVILTDMVENVSQETLEELRQETPLELLGKPEHVADAIFYLASPQASFVTGTVLDVSGGFVM
jgi:3-oxoacyl-[acyl-carrier protein] reductase